MTTEKKSVDPTPDEIAEIHHRNIQARERKDDWAWAMFYRGVQAFAIDAAYNRLHNKTAHFCLTATKRGPTTKGIET